ncbi:uncharacterized protein FPRO_12649 [Fusarium proliferatum ET1]|uniref:Uncharacterized protein n=1 Tax=Fusarium proliferatum (strain ET1) TaxID=1227346 RepID=A0A1L7W605_FUSPR|nr:uncharacterized protein FPRO_12649 [Fusarium proliferatum ET1]CZR48039.1 uncharacterized protein FPRO_12649 [Fusarium proliferatum ET1]
MIPLVFIWAVLASAQLPVPNLGPELSDNINFKKTVFIECNNFIQTCAPTISSCASVICKQCTGLGQKALNACCASESEPASCLGSALRVPNSAEASATTSEAGPTSSSSQAAVSTTTAEAPLVTKAPSGIAACASVSKSLDICNSLSPGVITSSFLFQAPCLCYNANYKFDPSIYDEPFSNCLAYYSTASPSFYASLAASSIGSKPCASIGDVVKSCSETGSCTPVETGTRSDRSITSGSSDHGSTSTLVPLTTTTSTKNAGQIVSSGDASIVGVVLAWILYLF